MGINVGKIFIPLFIFCFIFFLVPSWLLTYPPELRSFIAKQTGLIIKIESLNWHLNDFPRLYLEAQEINVYSQQEQSPIVNFKQLSSIWNLPELFFGRVSLDQVEVQKSQVEANISESGDVQIGNWVLAELQGETNGFDLFTFHVNQLNLDEGMLQIQFPASWEIPLIGFSSIDIRWQPKQKDFQISTNIEWDGKTGRFTGDFHHQQEHWQGNYQLSQIPLHVWTIPGVPNAFPSMPVDGTLSGEGTVEWDALLLKSQLDWKIEDGKIFNRKFPSGEMFIKSIDGKMNFLAETGKGAVLGLNLKQVPAPQGLVDAQTQIHFLPGQAPRMTVLASGANWKVNTTMPYVYGFVPDVASDWMQEHLHGGELHTVHFDLDWKITTEFEDVNEVLHLNLRTEVSGVNIDPFEDVPRITNLHGYLQLGLWGVGIEVDRGEFPGTKITGGSFAIGYGAPVVTPLKLEILGESEASITWPAVRAMWSDSIPWLEQLSFHGPADARFVLDDPNILDEEPLSIEVTVIPQTMELEWKTSNHQYHLTSTQGIFTATLDTLDWENFYFTSGPLSGTMRGKYPFDEQQTPRFFITLEHVQNLLPVYEKKESAMGQWMPQQLSAKAELWPKEQNSESTDLWQLDVVTTDEKGQHLNAEIELDGSSWTIPHFSGSLGKITANGNVDFRSDKGNIHVQTQPVSENSVDFDFKWEQGIGQVSFQPEYFSWQHWLDWKLPTALEALIPPQTGPPPVTQWKIHFQSPHLILAPELEIPVSFTGTFTSESMYQLSLSTLKIGKESGSLFYEGNLQKGKLLLQWDQFNLLHWIDQIQLYVQTQKHQATLPDPVDIELFQELQIDFKVTDFFLPDNPPLPFSTRFHVYQLPQERKVVIDDLTLGSPPTPTARREVTGSAQAEIQEAPLFAFPDVPNVFPRMPFYGQLNAAGHIRFDSAGPISSQIDWKIMEGVLKNRKFPAEQMEVTNVKGNVVLELLPEEDSFLVVNVEQADIPFGQIQASANLLFFSESNPIISITANSSNWAAGMTRPYLYGLMPDLASSWLQDHTTGGDIEAVNLDLHLELSAGTPNVADILNMELTADVGGMTVVPFEGVPEFTEVAGHLKLGIWGGELDIRSGSFPGGQLEGGKLSLLYGAPVHSPFQLNLKGTADSHVSWPAIRPLWSDEVPWLNQLSFTGAADFSFSLEDQDILDTELPTIEIKVVPDNMAVQWETSNYDFYANHLQGVFIATLDEIVFEKFHFTSDQIQGSLEGRYPFETERLPHFHLQLEQLETLLPTYRLKNHPFEQWFPKNLSAKIELFQQTNPANSSLSWKLLATTTDEHQQHLNIEMLITDQDWKIQHIAGKLGQIQTKGELDLLGQTGFLSLNAPYFSQDSIDVRLQWANESGFVAIEMPQLQWKDWLYWDLSKISNSWLGNSPSSEFIIPHWDLQFKTSAFVLSPTLQPPVSFSGRVTLGETYQVTLPDFKVGSANGNLSYEGNLQKGNLHLSWPELNPLHLLETATSEKILLPEKIFPDSTQPATVGDVDFFDNLQIELETPQFHVSDSLSNPLHVKLHLQRVNGKSQVIIDHLMFGKQQASGVLNYQDNQWETKIHAKRIDVVPWVEMIYAWSAETPTKATSPALVEKATSLSTWPSIKFDIKTENLYFDDTWHSPSVLRGYLDFQESPSKHHLPETMLIVEHFDGLGQQGTGRIVWGDGYQHLSLHFQKMKSFELISNLLKVSSKISLDAESEKKTPTQKETFDFHIKAPEKELNLQGTVQWTGEDYQIFVNQLNWDRQHGKMEIEYRDNRFHISGNFAYLDLGLWNALVEQIQEEEEPSTNSGKTFTVDLPENDWNIEIEANKVQFLDSVFDAFAFQGRFGPQEIKIPKLVWKKRKKQVFSLAGYLNRVFESTPEGHWDGKLSTDIYDLGDMMEMLFGNDSPIVKQFPITRGNTQLQAAIQLFPASNNQWIPHARISFKSNEGIIKRGHILAFFLATLSIQSYLKVVEGKLSGFEGQGLVYNTMVADIKMQGSLFELEKFIFASPNMRIVTSGKLNYENRQEDLLVCFQPFETLDLILGKIPLLNRIMTSKRGSFVEGCYQSRGLMDNPSIIPLPHTLLLPGRIRDMLILDFLQQQQEVNTNFDVPEQ